MQNLIKLPYVCLTGAIRGATAKKLIRQKYGELP